MSSIVQTPHRRQAVPDPIQGVVVGIDVSKGRIDWRACCLGQWGSPHRVTQGEAGFLRFEQHLLAAAEGGQEVWVALESTGPYGQCLQEWLLDRGWRVVLVNPYHVKRSRELHDGNPRKDDVKDPGVIADLVWQGSYRRVRRLYGPYAELRVGFGQWCSLAKSRTALRNEAQALLELWFPELVRLFANPLGKSVQALIGRYDSPSALLLAGRRSLHATLKRETHGRGVRYGEGIWKAAQGSVAVRQGQESRVRALRDLLGRLACVEAQQVRLRAELERWLAQTEEGAYLRSVPGLGLLTAAGVLGECGPLAEFHSVRALEKFVGMNLYRISSGKREGQVHLAKRGRQAVRALLVQLAVGQMRVGRLGGAWVQQRKAQGHPSRKTQIALARKLLALCYALAKHRVCFETTRWFAEAKTADGGAPLQGTPTET